MSNLSKNTTDLRALLVTVNNLPEVGGGGLDTSDATAQSSDILSGKTAYVNGEKITGTISTVTQATPSVSINSSGLITASATQSEGYVTSGTKSGTKQLTTQGAKTITPSKSSQTAVSSGRYTTGTVTVAAIPSNYITTSDATAQANEIFQGETAYVNGSKVAGTFTIQNEITEQTSLISQIATALAGKASAGNPSGGFDIETCLLTFTTNVECELAATVCWEDNTIGHICDTVLANSTVEIYNVVKQSIVAVCISSVGGSRYQVDDCVYDNVYELMESTNHSVFAACDDTSLDACNVELVWRKM